MSEAAMNITDIELVRLLRASYIDREQVKELQPLIPELTAEERQQLIDLISQSHEEAEKAESAYQERLRDINAQYDIALNNLVKESTENAMKEFEELEEKESTAELKEVEGEMAEMSSNTQPDTPVTQPVKKPGYHHVCHHPIAKLIVIILFFLIVAAIYIYSSLTV